MRVSELFRLRFLSAGLIAVATIGSVAIPANAQTPQAFAQGQSNTAPEKINSWLRDAEALMQQQQWDKAAKSLQVAEALCQSETALPPSVREQLAALQGKLAAQKSTGAATPPAVHMQPSKELLEARRALARGDIATAQSMVEAARKSGVDFQGQPDSPEIVTALIGRQNELATMAKAGSVDQYNMGAANFLLEQSQALLAYGDWDGSQFLAEQAQKFPVDFATTSIKPDALLAQVAAGRAAPVVNPAKAEVAKLMSQAQLAMDQEN